MSGEVRVSSLLVFLRISSDTESSPVWISHYLCSVKDSSRLTLLGLASFSCSKWMIKYQEIPFYFFSFPRWGKAPFCWPASVSWSLQGRFKSLFTLVWALVRLWWAPWGWCEHSEARCFPFPSLRAWCWGRKGLFTFIYLFHIQPGETSHFLTIICLFCTITSGIRRKQNSESPELMRAIIFESWLRWFGVGWYIFEN